MAKRTKKIKTSDKDFIRDVIEETLEESKPKDSDYTATIKVFGKTYTSEGETVKEAIEGLKPLGSPKGTCILKLSRGEVTKERILNTVQVSRLFSPSRIVREISLKGISSLFDL